jgi:hypothetical protein
LIDPFTPEFRLVAACCRFPQNQAAKEAVNAAVAGISSWQQFEALVARHRVTGLANHALADQQAVPREVSARLARRARESAAFDLVLAAETAALQQRFDEAGLPALFVKGATVGVLAYGTVSIKESWDIDLLTTPESVEPALKIMEGAGYQLIFPTIGSDASGPRFLRFFHEVVLRNPRGVPVELHWRLSAKSHDLPGLDARAAHQVVDVVGRPVKTLCDEFLISYLIAHGQQHGWSRLKWLADLNALLSQRNAEEIQSVWDQAQALGLANSASAALMLCGRLFDLQLPAKIAEVQGRRRSVDRLVRVDLACMAHVRGGSELSEVSPTHVALVLSRIRSAAGWRNLAGELAVIWTQPDVRARYPARLDFLYHLLRIPLFLARIPLKLHRLHRMSRSGRNPLRTT